MVFLWYSYDDVLSENKYDDDDVSELQPDRIRIWKSGDNVNSKSDYTIGLIVLDLPSQTTRCQNYTQNFISFTTCEKTQDCMAKSPNSKWPPKFPRSYGKIPSSGSTPFCRASSTLRIRYATESFTCWNYTSLNVLKTSIQLHLQTVFYKHRPTKRSQESTQ